MRNRGIIKLLSKSVIRLPSSVIIMARILSNAGLQGILKKYGVGKPIIILCGKPGNGKTSLVRALLGNNNENEIKFVCGLRAVKKIIEKIETGYDEKKEKPILFLDNFPEPLTHQKLDVGRRILDHVIDIASEDEKAPLVIITGEPNILEEVEKVSSLIGRTLIIQMPKIDDDKELYQIRQNFSVYQHEYTELWDDYDKWAENNPIMDKEVNDMLRDFRQRYNKRYESRQIGLVFCYNFAMLRFSKFLQQEYSKHITVEDIAKNVQKLFEWKDSSNNVRSSYEVDIWKSFINDCVIHNIIIPKESACMCVIEADCDGDRYNCYHCEGYPVKCYDPMDLRLPSDAASAILIEKPSMIPNFPKPAKCNSPLLMIQIDSLLEMLNTYLEEYSRKNRISVRRITPKRLTKELFAHNLCLYEYVGTKHNTYTFKMKDNDNKDIRVIFIKLTMQQYQKLKDSSKTFGIQRFTGYYSAEYVRGMKSCLEYFCTNVQSLIGEIGTPSKLLDDAY